MTRIARELDRLDALGMYRGRFHIPEADGARLLYLNGNSLGLQPRGALRAVTRRMNEWARLGVNAWHDRDWMTIDHALSTSMARIVGASPAETAVTGTLTANLHALLASFYRPRGKRRLVLMEATPFPSDRYAVAGQVRWHNLDPAEVILIAPDTGDDSGVLEALDRWGDEVALVLVGGVNYLSGQLYDMERIAAACRSRDCVIGLDLAHAAGNVPLSLHDWGVDFAAWCGYKYLNGGPGAPAGLFVHARHHDPEMPRLRGWWGHDRATRFEMPPGFAAEPGAAGWQLSTPPVIGLAALEASCEIFDQAGMEAIVQKSHLLTDRMAGAIQTRLGGRVAVITPSRRGAQLSLRVSNGRKVFEALARAGVVCDWREPDVIRVAPAPLYNSFQDVDAFVDALDHATGNQTPSSRI